jgi:hypothetical protein
MYWLVACDATEDVVILLTLRHFQVSNLQCPHGVCNHFQRLWAGESFSPSQANLSFRHWVGKRHCRQPLMLVFACQRTAGQHGYTEA